MKTDFREVKQEIHHRIVSGQWSPGQLLPNEVDLAAEFDCARATVNRAMRELAEEGLIDRKRKAGTRVRNVRRRRASFDILRARKEVEALGARYRFVIARRYEQDAPDWVRARLDLPEEARVLHVVTLHHADGSPFQLDDRWINLEALPDAREVDFDAESPNEWLLHKAPFAEAEMCLSACRADDDMARFLGCARDEALLLNERSIWQDDVALAYARIVYGPGYRMTAQY
jgi:GntR family histidine utilization transcriptional repressor